ncbi:MAG: T9SS type A sorting domain-containing protein, partial [Calditrichaeota bacterium]|nr:T9SS type A sorting domain-containing protein [Calditrichota bacterium]
MRRKVLLTVLSFCLLTTSIFADYKTQKIVGPGVIHYHEFRQAGPWHLHVLEVDVSNPWIRLESVKANNRLSGNEKTSHMAHRRDSEGHRVVGAINADFYAAGGIPIGAQVVNGVLLKNPFPRSVFAFTENRIPLIDIVGLDGETFTSPGDARKISGVNQARDTDDLIVFNKFYGARTETNFWGTEVICEYVSQAATNDTFFVRVVLKDSVMAAGHGNNAIPQDGIVLSGHGTSRDFLNEKVFVGDTVGVILRMPPIKDAILTLVGGMPRLIRDGAVSVEWSQEGTSHSFAYDRHPRTGVGISEDSSKVYFFTVDGRQSGYSVGMSLFEFANYMHEWGVFQGVNLDGGGSTTMVVRGKVVNSPSDAAGERAVANALLCVSTAPTGNLSILQIKPDEAFLISGKKVRFSVDGFDQFYNPLTISADSLVWTCDSIIGTISSTGLFSAGEKDTSGYVYVSVGTVRDSALVHVTRVASILLFPNPLVLDVGDYLSINYEARDEFGNIAQLAKNDFEWSVTGDFGTISRYGFFRATNPGQGFVVATYQAVSGSTAVYVGLDRYIIDDFSSLKNWSLSGLRMNLTQTEFAVDSINFVSEPSAAKLTYSLETGGVSVVYLNCALPIPGEPYSVGIHIYGDGKGHWLRGEFSDADGEIFLVDFTPEIPGIDWTNSWKYLPAKLNEATPHWSNPSAELTFPIQWRKIYLAETDENKKDSGVILLDDFTVGMVATAIAEKEQQSTPHNFFLNQNYPNPFNPVTQIIFYLPKREQVSLKVFNTLGERVTELIDETLSQGKHVAQFDAADMSSGVYFYRLRAGKFSQVK